MKKRRRVLWLTDLHLNFLDLDQMQVFLTAVRDQAPDIVLISGDIGEAHSLVSFLHILVTFLRRPIYFVLGNHDFYFGSLAGVRQAVRDLTAETRWLTWLTEAGVVALTAEVALVGHDSWADGRCGDYENSRVFLNDYLIIDEFKGLSHDARLKRLNALGDEAAAYFRTILPEAFATYRRAILVTHVPPFREACWSQGSISDDDFLPHFVCQAAGEALVEVMQARPDCDLLILCGHTHGSGEVQILPNLRVLTGGAEYGAPEVQRVFEFD